MSFVERSIILCPYLGGSTIGSFTVYNDSMRANYKCIPHKASTELNLTTNPFPLLYSYCVSQILLYIMYITNKQTLTVSAVRSLCSWAKCSNPPNSFFTCTSFMHTKITQGNTILDRHAGIHTNGKILECLLDYLW